ILRSLGKFFGLAGLRVGFVSATQDLLMRLQQAAGPWSIATASRYIAAQALRDELWQHRTREYLHHTSARLAALLEKHSLTPSGGSVLFQWVKTDKAARLHEQLAQQGILSRLFEKPASLRLGLPSTEQNWLRL